MKQVKTIGKYVKVILILLTAFFLIFLVLDEVIAAKLKKVLTDLNTKDLIISYSDINVSLFGGTVAITDLKVEIPGKLNSQASLAYINGLKVFALIKDDQLIINSLIISKPEITLLPDEGKDVPEKEFKSLWDLLKNNLSELSIEKIRIEDPYLSIKPIEKSFKTYKFESGSILIDNFKIDSVIASSKEIFTATKIDCVFKDLDIVTEDSLYTISCPSILINFLDRTASATNFKVEPNFDKKLFFVRKGEQTDRFDLDIHHIHFKGINLKELMNKGNIESSLLQLDSLNVEIYRDKTVPLKPKVKLFIQELLAELDFKLKIDSIAVPIAKAIYQEKTEKDKPAGEIRFDAISCGITNVNNTNPDDTIKFNARTLIFGESPLNLELIIPSGENKIYASGNISNLKLSRMNNMLNLGTVNITYGYCEEIKFNLNTDKIFTRGNLTMKYEGLKIAIGEKQDSSRIDNKATSFLVNHLLIKNSNQGKNARSVSIKRPYDNQKFMINSLWKSLLAGIKQTVGVPDQHSENN